MSNTSTLVSGNPDLIWNWKNCNDCNFEEGVIYPIYTSISDPVDPYGTDFGALAPRFTGSVSFISSSLIIYLILRSNAGLSTIYHRLLFGMSASDMMSSAAMAFTSLPFPTHMPYEEEFGYHWAGKRLGNTASCTAQGFFMTTGSILMYTYNATLCIYYACAIGFLMREGHIQKYIEPVLHGLPLFLGLYMGIPPLFQEMYNPSNLASYCSVVSYPTVCYQEDSCNIRGDYRHFTTYTHKIVFLIMVLFCTIIVSFALVICRAIQLDRHISSIKYQNNNDAEIAQREPSHTNNDDNEDSESNDNESIDTTTTNPRVEQEAIVGNVLDKRHHVKIIIKQALGYLFALIITLVFPALRLNVVVKDFMEISIVWDKLSAVFVPCQGFFNFIIFVSHKVYNYRRVNPDVPVSRVLRNMFCTRFQEPMFISRITIIERDVIDAENNGHDQGNRGNNNNGSFNGEGPAVFDIVLDDESGNRSNYLLSFGNDSNGASETPSNMARSNNDVDAADAGVISYTMDNSIHLSAGNDVFVPGVGDDSSKQDLSGFDLDSGGRSVGESSFLSNFMNQTMGRIGRGDKGHDVGDI